MATFSVGTLQSTLCSRMMKYSFAPSDIIIAILGWFLMEGGEQALSRLSA